MTNKFMQEFQREPTSEELKDYINEHYPNANIKDSADVINISMSSIDEPIESDDSVSNVSNITLFNTYSSSSLSLSYIAHPSQTPGSKNEEEKNTFFIISSSNTPGYNTYESLYTLTSSSFEYVSFVLTPLKFIDSASITITESKPSRFTMHPFLVIFLAIVALCIVCGIIGGISTIRNKSKQKKPEIEPTPKTDNYTPLTPQNQSPSPEQPYYAQSNQ